MQNLELKSYRNAIAALSAGLVQYQKTPNEFIRDACIQRFEFTYELSWKMLKRFIEQNSPNPAEIDEMSFQNLIRTGSEMGLLLSGWDIWAQYRHARSITSHVYDEAKALEVFNVIPKFFSEAQHLFKNLEKRVKK